MKKWMALLLVALPLWACVGQKEDPEPEPDPVPVTPVSGGEEEGTVFFHRVLAMGFTATWCQYCPNMSKALSDVAGERPDRIVTLSVHYMDELSAPEAEAITSRFKIVGYPSLVFDWNVGTLCSGQDTEVLLSYVDKALETEACGLAAEASAEDGVLTLSVRVKSVREAAYSVAAAWAEDNMVVDFQAGYGSGYSCNSVLRGYLAPGIGGMSLGTLKPQEEGSCQFTETLSDSRDTQYLVVYVLEDGIVANALRLKINDKVDYTYEKED